MYCSSCGAAVKQGLTYCNRCGEELSVKDRSSNRLADIAPDYLVWAIASVTIVGLGAVIGFMAVMKEVAHLNEGVIIAFTFLSFLTFLGVDSVFIWLLLRSRRGAKESGEITRPRKYDTKGIEVAQERALPEPALNITEHTTRTLEPAGGERKKE
jgi:predicted nucleic acid-binding Zn ribbon protein